MKRETLDKMCDLARTHSSKQIAQLLGLNSNTVKSTLSRLGVQIGSGRGRPKVNAEDVVLMVELKRQGLSLQEVANKFDISYDHASRLTAKRCPSE